MKKTLAAILALLMLSSVALVACKKDDKPNNDDGNNDPDGEFVQKDPSSDSTSDTGTGTDTTDTIKKDEFESVSKTVYVMSDVNLRSEPSSKQSAIVTSVATATELTVTAKNDDWYKITYNGETMYVVKDYVTDNKDNTVFTAIAEDDPLKTLTLVTNSDDTSPQVNIRKVPVVYDDVSFVTIDNKKVTAEKPLEILAKNTSGTWYKVKYDGSEYYLAINSSTRKHFNELKGADSGTAGG